MRSESALRWLQDREALRQLMVDYFCGVDDRNFPRVAEWFARIEARPATVRAYRIGAAINTTPTVTAESRAVLLNQGASTVAGGGS